MSSGQYQLLNPYLPIVDRPLLTTNRLLPHCPLLTTHCFTAYTYAKFISVQTVLTTSPAEAAEFIKNGGIVAFPTETVYGLAANIFNEKAIEKIFIAKRRPNDNPLIAHVANLDQIKTLASEINETAQKLIDEFYPGPLTLVLPNSQEFIKECGTPM